MGLFGAAHVSHNDETWQSHALPEENSKNV